MRGIDTFFFDLDGTLTDPVEGITRCIQHALQRTGLASPPRAELVWCIGPPLLESFETILGDPRRARAALVLYRERFGAVGLYENAVYDGIPEVLETLVAAGRRVFVATSKPTVYARRIVQHFGLDRYLDDVFGAELDGTRADKTALLAHAVAETGAAPARSAMIGDRHHDMAGARNNGLDAIGVLYGYGTGDELRAAGARHCAATPAELRHILPGLKASLAVSGGGVPG